MNKNSGRQYEYINGKKVEVTPQVYAFQIQCCYKRWKELYTKGGSDPFWCDGTNLNLVRNHIEYYRRKIEEMLGGMFHLYPDEYFWCDLPQVDDNYLASPRELFSDHYQKRVVFAASKHEYEVCF